ncbi:MAG TPA: serine/threonine-protein kinase [Kofleriaceae bacterium]|nr:serine/threonine-protein kinase [Kofleriaceae bacterium]
MTLLVAVGERRALSGIEEHELHQHVATCDACAELTMEIAEDKLRWIARIPEDAIDDTDLLVLPTIDPIVFAKGEELARGGMGRITRARDRRLGRDVAIKEVLAPELRARFEREATITARLQHPAIVPIYEAGAWPDGSAFYTMRLVSGGTLADAMGRTRTLEDRLALLPHVVAVTEALGYAHSRRVIHRDLKPANVLVGEFGETLVIDWGLAKELGRGGPDGAGGSDDPMSPELTRAGSVVGTPCFIAPEQAAGDEIDERADVYALGAILYNLLVGHPPHWDSTEHSAERLLDAARRAPPTPLHQLVPRTPVDLRAIVERAMAHDRAARFPTAVQMADELRRFQAGQLLRSREYSAGERFLRWVRRHRAAVGVGSAAIVVLAIVGAISVQQIVARERETRRALAESQLEQGRQLLVDGEPGQAAPYLAAALVELPGDPVAQRLAAIAVRDAPRRLGAFPGTAAAFRRDGHELAIGRRDGSIAVVDLATGAVLRALPPPGQGGEVKWLDWTPDGASLAVASTTGAYLCDAATGTRVVTLRAGPVTEVRLAPRGDAVVVASPAALSLVGLDGAPIAEDPEAVETHKLAASSDGTTLVALVRGGVAAWRASDLARVATQPIDDVVFTVASDHGDFVTAALGGGVRRWHGGGSTTLIPEPIVALSSIDDHTLLADATVIHTDTGALQRLGYHSVQASAAVAGHVVASGYDRTLRVWDRERDARPIIVLDTEAASGTLIADPTGRRAVSRGWRPDDRFELWDIAHRDAPVQSAVVGTQIDAVIADRGDRLAIRVTTATGDETRLITTGFAQVATLDGWPEEFRPGREEIITSRAERFTVYSSRDGRWIRDIVDPAPIRHFAFSRTGATIVTCSARRVLLRDSEWQVVASFEVPSEPWALAVDDAGRVVTGHSDGTLRIWDARSGALLATATGHAAYIVNIEIRDGELVTGSWDLTTRRWAFPSGKPLGIFKSFGKVVHQIAMSPGSEWFATAGGSATLDLWDSAHGRLVQQIPTSDRIRHVAFIDDHRIAVGGEGGRLELIDIALPAVPLDEVNRRVAASPRWRLVDGHVVEQAPSEALR